MSGFDTIVVVDWSGGNDTGPRPRKDAIWASLIRGDRLEPSVYLRNRVEAERWLSSLFAAEIDSGRRVFAGFDFPFGYPAGYAEVLTGRADPLAIWDWYAKHLRDTRQRAITASRSPPRSMVSSPVLAPSGSTRQRPICQTCRARDACGKATA